MTDPELLGSATNITTSAVESPSNEPIQSVDIPQGNDLYRWAMKAVCAGLSHQFISEDSHEWMSLGTCTYIDMTTMGQNPFHNISRGSATNVVNFESKWDNTGCLSISPTISQVENLRQVAAIIDSELQLGTPLLLLPSGISTNYRGRLQKVASDSVQISKVSCTNFLESQDLSVSPESEWILVQVDLARAAQENFVTIWPAEYALIKTENLRERSVDLEPEMIEDTDPMARAETWYLGRAARAAKADIIQKEIELQAQQQHLQREISDRDVSDVASPAFRDLIAPQDISGIYPTPPDGLLSQTPVSTAQQEASPKFATTGGADENPGFIDGANEDLFEDMDMELVGEADFNFFDEPGIEETMSESHMAERKSEDAGVDAFLPEPSTESQAANQDLEHEKTEDGNLISVAGDDDTSLALVSPDNDESHLRTRLFQGDISERDDSNHRNRESNIPESRTRGSFNPLPLGNLNFDNKYGSKGRFGFIDLKHDSLTSHRQEKREIYQIGTQVDSVGSPDSDDEDAVAKDQPNLPLGYEVNEDLQELSSFYREASNANVATPESTITMEDQVHLRSAPLEIFFPTNDQDGAVGFVQFLSSPKTTPTFAEHASTFIQVAQLVLDQVGRTSSSPSISSNASLTLSKSLASIITNVFPSAHRRLLKNLLKSDAGQVNKLENAAVGIQRIGVMTDISSSAISFWEELGLSPRSGPKNINAFCVFSMKEYLVRPVKTFLEMMKGTYQVCNLGKHTLDDPQSPYPHGLVPVPNNGVFLDKDVSIKFVKYISNLRLTGGNTVIYMLNTWGEEAIPDMCRYFLAMFYAYRKSLEQEDIREPNDLVLQIVPADMVFSNHELILSSPTDYKKLAFQVYDRCAPPGGNGQAPFVSAPAISLAKSTLKTIDFKLTVDPLDTGDVLHLAYQWEANQQWLTGAWTNNSGTIQWNAAYWLSEDEDIQTSFLQVASAMIETTRDIIQSQRASYHVYIAKLGPYENFEVEGKFELSDYLFLMESDQSKGWEMLANSELRVSLVEIDSEPSLMLFSPRNLLFPSIPDFLTSPDATPYTSTGALSPDVSAHVSTPGGTVVTSVLENDPDARLIDITDEAWTIVTETPARDMTQGSSHPLPISVGYILKRAGTQNEDGLLALLVNVIRDQEPRQKQMKELLSMYRDLAMLAKVRNILDPVKSILPIHVATVGEAHKALCRTMQYGG